MKMKESDIANLIVGIAKTQAAIVNVFCRNDIQLLSRVKASLVAIYGSSQQQANFSTLPSLALDVALSTRGPNQKNLQEEVLEVVSRLISKSG